MTSTSPRVRTPARGDVLRELSGDRWWVWTGQDWSQLLGVTPYVDHLVHAEVRYLLTQPKAGEA